MNVWKVFGAGIRQVFHHKKLLLLFYVPNLLLAYILTVPVKSALQRAIGHSLVSEEVARFVNISFLVELSREHPGLISALLSGVGGAMLVTVLLNTFLLGGAVSSLTLRRSSAWGEVFADSATYFGRFFRLFLLSLVGYALAIFLAFFLNRGFVALGRALADSSGSFAGRIAGLVTLAVFVLFVNQIFDYAKILTTRYDEPRAWHALRRSLGFIFSDAHFWRTLFLYYLVTAFAVLAVVVYNGGASVLDFPSNLFILLLFLWRQLFILVKVGIKLLYYSSQAMYVNAQLPQVEPMEPTEFLA